jgi:hypothetical protein
MQTETTFTFTRQEVIDMLRDALMHKEIYGATIRFNIGNDPTWDGPGTLPVLSGMTVTVKE